MSRTRLIRWLTAVCFWLLIILALYFYGAHCQVKVGTTDLTTIIKDIIPVALAIPTAFLAYAFARRNSYLQALREFWKQLVPSMQKAIQYTHLAEPKQTDFAPVMESLSSAIDLTRGVFSNISKNGSRGLFPHENLKDIQSIISWLGFGESFKKADAAKARQCITALWQEMHHAMLAEFDRDVPVTPVSKYLYQGESVADLLISKKLIDEDLEKHKPASHPRG